MTALLNKTGILAISFLISFDINQSKICFSTWYCYICKVNWLYTPDSVLNLLTGFPQRVRESLWDSEWGTNMPFDTVMLRLTLKSQILFCSMFLNKPFHLPQAWHLSVGDWGDTLLEKKKNALVSVNDSYVATCKTSAWPTCCFCASQQ